ncbi:MAG: tRNA (5-methylaminomethyl-2-thiouridine)(34)-methyltransferase MnmD [Paludibacteraceae bacterium]|nr:tRNA (5-methylaminomethyl-2-thiouridine)(34)-methyltransferase MnmD [Paludibacteraceae bacterium]MBN2787312.1 tRNA (5-methylaminomethyl-2-thiouridine)(34)-methyltransferase MnmD [Paludibacteraceae bacterium]
MDKSIQTKLTNVLSPSIGGGFGKSLILNLTKDGSHTLYVPAIDETYHSVYGAINESHHVFIEAGLSLIQKEEITVLEIGFGTGLNAFLAAIYATQYEKKIQFTSIEKYPLNEQVWQGLNYGEELGNTPLFKAIHMSKWEQKVLINPHFTLYKLDDELENLLLYDTYDCIFFDAFSPEKQPELWTEDIFYKMYNYTAQGGLLTTYCAKGAVRRAMQAVGYKVERIPGPIGKREMLRAIKE